MDFSKTFDTVQHTKLMKRYISMIYIADHEIDFTIFNAPTTKGIVSGKHFDCYLHSFVFHRVETIFVFFLTSMTFNTSAYKFS